MTSCLGRARDVLLGRGPGGLGTRRFLSAHTPAPQVPGRARLARNAEIALVTWLWCPPRAPAGPPARLELRVDVGEGLAAVAVLVLAGGSPRGRGGTTRHCRGGRPSLLARRSRTSPARFPRSRSGEAIPAGPFVGEVAQRPVTDIAVRWPHAVHPGPCRNAGLATRLAAGFEPGIARPGRQQADGCGRAIPDWQGPLAG
jgi:hypothetical protein